MTKRRLLIFSLLICIGFIGCNPDVTLFNQSFISLFTGGEVPIAPGPDSGHVMVLVMNSTDQSIEFVVTAELEEIIVHLDGTGGIVGLGESGILEPQTVNLVTDVDSPTLAIVFDNTPVDFPPVGPNEIIFEHVQDVLAQITAKDPEFLFDRDFIRLVRVLRVGLGPDLDVPSGQDDGIVVRPAGSDPNLTAGSIFPSGLNNALSYDVGSDPADFGNGDIIIFLATSKASAVGGIALSAGVIDGDEANINSDTFIRDTFEILRREEGPINPLPSN